MLRLDLAAIKQDLDAVSGRITDLRTAPAFNSALAELEGAEKELRTCADEIERLALAGEEEKISNERRQREIVRAAFQELPGPAFILDENGMIRGINRHGAALLGVTASYATGKPFAVFVELPWRVSFRCELSDVLREGGERAVACRVGTVVPRQAELEIRLARLDSVGRHAADRRYLLATTDPGESAHQLDNLTGHREIMAASARIRRLGLMGRLTRLLLGGRDVPRLGLLTDAANLLAAECADWIVVDLLRDGCLERAVVAGPEKKDTLSLPQVLDGLDPGQSKTSREIVETGAPVLHFPLTGPGRNFSNGQIRLSLRTSSAAGVAIRDETEIFGALLLVRAPDRAAFTVTDVALYEELGLHIGLALSAAAA